MDRIFFSFIMVVLLFIANEVRWVNRNLKEIESKLGAILKAK